MARCSWCSSSTTTTTTTTTTMGYRITATILQQHNVRIDFLDLQIKFIKKIGHNYYLLITYQLYLYLPYLR